jgi:hypothetical protein
MSLVRRLVVLPAAFAGPAGVLAAKFQIVAPTPAMFFALGVMATLCVAGIGLGVWSTFRPPGHADKSAVKPLV